MNSTNAMRTVKVGMMPGRLVEIAVEASTTVREAFEIAQVEVPTGYEVRMDGEKVEMENKITGNLVVASKMIKGNAVVKIGMMPGRLVELATEGTETVKELFDMAGIEIPSGYEVRMDGDKINIDAQATGGLIVASKMIKGNIEMRTIKVGLMPGRLVEMTVEGGETPRQILSLAGIELPSGFELRLDGEKVDLDVPVTGNLLVGSKMIKGNSSTTKVGLMPGRLVEIMAEEGMTVAQRFEIAGVEVPSGYEVRADGEKVSMEDTRSYNLLVASKMIKGNK